MLRRVLLTFLLGFTVVHAQPATEPHPYSPALFKALRWRSIGPYRGGRVTAVAGVPGQAHVYYMGATGGGVWKTDDSGITWATITDGFVQTGSVGAIAVAPSDPSVVYVGMGEACLRGNFSHGDGVYKSTDAGSTWKHVGLADSRQIGTICSPPARIPNRVRRGARPSVRRRTRSAACSARATAARTWEQGAVCRRHHRRHRPRASIRSTRATSTRRSGRCAAAVGDLQRRHRQRPVQVDRRRRHVDRARQQRPARPACKGRIGLAVSPRDTIASGRSSKPKDGGVFRSDDAGATWQRMNGDSGVRERAWYYSHIIADPQDADTVYVLNVEI